MIEKNLFLFRKTLIFFTLLLVKCKKEEVKLISNHFNYTKKVIHMSMLNHILILDHSYKLNYSKTHIVDCGCTRNEIQYIIIIIIKNKKKKNEIRWMD